MPTYRSINVRSRKITKNFASMMLQKLQYGEWDRRRCQRPNFHGIFIECDHKNNLNFIHQDLRILCVNYTSLIFDKFHDLLSWAFVTKIQAQTYLLALIKQCWHYQEKFRRFKALHLTFLKIKFQFLFCHYSFSGP